MTSFSGTTSPLPPLYEKWMAELLPGPIAGESEATCNDCAMLPSAAGDPEQESTPDVLFFEPSTKCCTFLPDIPNYLVGRILSDTDPDAQVGRETLVNRLYMRSGLTPLGLRRPMSYALRYRHSPDGFGRKRTLRCPHYLEDGRCGIWRHRESTCATWFCKHTRGAVSLRFWRAIQTLLSIIEHHLSGWCANQLGIDNEAVREIFHEGSHPLWKGTKRLSTHLLSSHLLGDKLGGDSLGALDRESYEKLWGTWVDREQDFYSECGRLVENIKLADIAGALAEEVTVAIKSTLDTYDALMSTAVPARLETQDFDVVQIGSGTALLKGYSAYDLQRMPAELAAVLPRFDGRSTEEIRREIAAEHGMHLTDALVRKLVDFGLLAQPKEESLQES